MCKAIALFACLLTGIFLVGSAIHADLPLPTEEQIEAKLKEVRKRIEAAQEEEKALRKRLEEIKETPRGQIKAEVEGILCWQEEGGLIWGYYVRIRPKEDPKQETRVWLPTSPDKNTARRLAELKGKEIVIKGILLQSLGTEWLVPSGGMYMQKFELEESGPDTKPSK
jgi:hypothetical protein